ncbi:GDSL esterase/lipase [Ananas comosus]|uniref:GDSL esterase/lipase n=1 Tax=Ananas comosus TaxID=4615 RepID=A0A199UNG3_ANACO|nr:GDSL esterase/lipase [Ananas comosus]
MAALTAIVLTVFALTICNADAADATTGQVTYVFGDSMAEVGNNNYLPNALAKSNYPWYGVDYIKGQPTGRFTNGRTVGDIMSAKLGVPSPPPFLSLSMNDDAILKGVNYASGGAGILNETGLYFIQKLSFYDQITCFEKTKAAIVRKIGKESAEELCNEAIYFIGLGSNDYVNNFLQPFMADGQQYTHDEFVGLVITTLDGQLRRLYDLGARKVVFHGLGPLGCIPSQRVKSRNGQCLHVVNNYVTEFNARVKDLLDGLNNKLPGAQMAFADSYSIVMDLINNPQNYGFKISHTSCCNVDSVIGGLCSPNSKLCANRSEFVFWDAYHTSDAANQVIADRLFSDRADVGQAPSPAPLLGPAASPGPAPSPL